MMNGLAHGVIAPVFTVFHDDGALDDKGQCHLLDALMETKSITAYFLRSGLGQMYTFSYEDVVQITKNACAHLAGKAPVYIGAAGIWNRNWDRRPDPEVYTRQAVAFSKLAEDEGASAVVHTMPEAILPREGQTPGDVSLEYFERISNATKLPIYLYQPPGTEQRFRVTPDLVRRLADVPRVKGLKLSTTDAEYFFNVTWAIQDKEFVSISGAETVFYPALCCGAKAVIGQGSCVSPRILKTLQERFDRGDYAGSMEAQRSSNLLIEKATNGVEFFKRYLNEKGYPMSSYTRPVTDNPYWKSAAPLTDDQYNEYKPILEAELAKYAN